MFKIIRVQLNQIICQTPTQKVHLSSHLSGSWSTYTIPSPIITWVEYSFSGKHPYANHINYMIHDRPFGLMCSEAMSAHARLVKLNPSVLRVQLFCTRCMWTLSLSHPIITWCLETKNCRNGAQSGRTQFRLEILVRDHLIMLPSF